MPLSEHIPRATEAADPQGYKPGGCAEIALRIIAPSDLEALPARRATADDPCGPSLWGVLPLVEGGVVPEVGGRSELRSTAPAICPT